MAAAQIAEDYDVEGCEEHDSCGVTSIVDLDGRKSNKLLQTALLANASMHHRAGITFGDDGEIIAADGAGVLFDLDRDQFSQMLSQRHRKHLENEPHRLQVAMFQFDRNLPDDKILQTKDAIQSCFTREGLKYLEWREVPVDERVVSEERLGRMARCQQLFFLSEGTDNNADAKQIFTANRRINSDIRGVKVGSLVPDRIVYKELLTPGELLQYFLDLQELNASTAVGHGRFSTNVLSASNIAQPFGTIAHNGEINSVAANRKALVDLGRWFKFFNKIWLSQGSDSAHFNDALELLIVNGVSLPEAIIRLVPPAIAKTHHKEFQEFICANKRAMGTFGMWEGPAAIHAFDGTYLVVHSDRLGLRPTAFVESKNGDGHFLNFTSEIGAVDIDFPQIIKTGRLSAGGISAVRVRDGKIFEGDELLTHVLENTGLNWRELNSTGILVPRSYPDAKKWKLSKEEIESLRKNLKAGVRKHPELLKKLAAFGWKEMDVESALKRIAQGSPIITSMGVHGPLAILDPRMASIYDLYLQRAAIITNPPFDPTGEADVIEEDIFVGAMPRIALDKKNYKLIFPQWALESPIIPTNVLKEIIERPYSEESLGGKEKAPNSRIIDISFEGDSYKDFEKRLNDIVEDITKMAHPENDSDAGIIILTDRNAFGDGSPRLCIPPILLVQKIRTSLINKGVNRNLSIIVDSGSVRSSHDIGVLLANGASGVCPWMLDEIAQKADNPEEALKLLYDGERKELVKMMSKLGITTSLGAEGGYWFSAVGLSEEVVNEGGAKTSSKVGGLDKRAIFKHLVLTQKDRYATFERWMAETTKNQYKAEGAYDKETRTLLNLVGLPELGQLRKIINADECPKLYNGTELTAEEMSDIAYSAASRRRNKKLLTLRDCLECTDITGEVSAEALNKAPSVNQILEKLSMAHMSLGAFGDIAHAAIVRGCNRAGVKSASGEGGEEPERSRDGPRSLDRSYSHMIGTAGWGVDLRYLMEADEICIKVAQGAKPGEGGDVPEEKVKYLIADIRHVRMGTRLISPPPNHDIYSIEDLKARIHGLKILNPCAKISIKIASMPNLGTIAVGAVKAGADKIEISGYDAGTGAAGEQSINHCGLPVEIGLAEAHQYLVAAGLRHRVELSADGKMMTAQDCIKMWRLGADITSLGTVLMSYIQCLACNNCHTDKCPTGQTTTDEERELEFFVGSQCLPQGNGDDKEKRKESLIEFGSQCIERGLKALARDIQLELVKAGITAESFDEMIGQVDLLRQKETGNPIIDSLDLEKELLKRISPKKKIKHMANNVKNASAAMIADPIGEKILRDAEKFLNGDVEQMEFSYKTKNTDREVAVALAGQVYERLIRVGKLKPENKITIKTHGYAGHNYGFAIGDGIELSHEGFLNDSVGQYMSGKAKIAIKAPNCLCNRRGQTLVGNQAGMCATGGTLYCGGMAGARFGVRNSGASIVAEGALDYPFEYQTAGRGILLGDFIGNIGSRMTGGELFIYDPNDDRKEKIAKDYVKTVEISEDDFESLFAELKAFAADTDSEMAKMILARWKKEKGNFVKIVTKDT